MKTVNPLLFHTVSCRTGSLPGTLTAGRLLLLLSLSGVAAGAVLRTLCPLLPGLSLLMQGLQLTDAPRTLWDACRNALCPLLILLCALILSSSSAVGQPLAVLVLFLRGTGIGLAAADALLRLGTGAGLTAAGTLILPFGYCSVLILVRGAEASIPLSSALTRCLFLGQAAGEVAVRRTALLKRIPALLLLSLTACGLHTVLIWLFHDRLVCGILPPVN